MAGGGERVPRARSTGSMHGPVGFGAVLFLLVQNRTQALQFISLTLFWFTAKEEDSSSRFKVFYGSHTMEVKSLNDEDNDPPDSRTILYDALNVGLGDIGKSKPNKIFQTNFREMDTLKGRTQITTGICIAKCIGIEPCTIVMNLEGCDGRERGEVEAIALPNFDEKKEQFDEQVKLLRNRFMQHSIALGGLVGDRDVLLASEFSFNSQQVWNL